MTKQEAKTAAQMRTFAIFKSMPKYDLLHIFNEFCKQDSASDCEKNMKFFDTHVKRAAAMTASIYQYGVNDNSLTEETEEKLARSW
jgi:hypothetical protein